MSEQPKDYMYLMGTQAAVKHRSNSCTTPGSIGTIYLLSS